LTRARLRPEDSVFADALIVGPALQIENYLQVSNIRAREALIEVTPHWGPQAPEVDRRGITKTNFDCRAVICITIEGIRWARRPRPTRHHCGRHSTESLPRRATDRSKSYRDVTLWVAMERDRGGVFTAPIPRGRAIAIKRHSALPAHRYRSEIRIGGYREVAPRNSRAPQFAHSDDDVHPHEAAELGKKAAPVTTGEQSPEAFLDCHILLSRSARHILARKYKKRRWPWAE
jgi:hypothetical protein